VLALESDFGPGVRIGIGVPQNNKDSVSLLHRTTMNEIITRGFRAGEGSDYSAN